MMISENKNKWGSENSLLSHKSGLKTRIKILVLGLALVMLAEILSPVKITRAEQKTATGIVPQYNASAAEIWGACTMTWPDGHQETKRSLDTACKKDPSSMSQVTYEFKAYNSGTNPDPTPGATIYQTAQQTAQVVKKDNGPKESAFETAMKTRSCTSFLHVDVAWCFVRVAYTLFYAFPAFLLWASAYFFNILISITLSSRLFADSAFIPSAWATVRDLSNIFFILILLYIAVKIILGIGGSEAKRMIAKVLIIALLINFSMFFTEVIIDSSNILALIFYNKISVCTNENAKTGDCRKYDEEKNGKDVAGGLVSNFDPTTKMDPGFFKQAGKQPVPGRIEPNNGEVPAGIMFGIIMITGGLMFFAAYALFVSGFSFLGRLIELWVLIIFSPFAFMSFSIPLLGKVDYIGWDAWSKRLITTSFMAPIFMFFLYFIFQLISVKPSIFDGLIKITTPTSFIESLLLIVLPGIMILILLRKATSYAKKGSGEIGDMVFKAAKIAGGIGLAAATGGVAMAGTGLIGGVGGLAANKATSGMNKLGDTKWGRRLGANKVASGLTSVGALAQRSSFDARGIKIGGQSLASATGLKIGEAKKGGIEQRRKERVEKDMKRADSLKVRQDEKISQDLKKAEIDLQVMLNQVAGDFHIIDEEIKDLRQKKQDETDLGKKQELTDEINKLLDAKKDIKTGKDATYTIGKTTRKTVAPEMVRKDKDGKNATIHIADLASSNGGIIEDLKNKKEAESRRRTTAYANRISNWRHWGTVAKEAKHKIIMESKLPESVAKT